MISLCMIVKDEEKILNDMLKSIKDYVSDIVIIDTGSKDKTKEIALKYTNKVFDFKWCNDFSKARNYSIEKADNDIILVLDADEKVVEFNYKEVIRYINDNPKSIGRISCKNLFKRNKQEFRYNERVNRVFSKKYYRYDGYIHEQIVMKSNMKVETYEIPIVVNHIGYQDEIIGSKDKISRNISLLMEMLKKNGDDPYLYYQLGKSYYMAGEYLQASKEFENALKKNVDTDYEYVEDLIETYGYSLINSQQYEEAKKILKLYDIYEKNSDFVFLSGLIFMNNGYIEEAINEFKKATTIKVFKMEGVNSYLAYYNLGVIHECIGDFQKAKNYYMLSGDYEMSVDRLKNLKT